MQVPGTGRFGWIAHYMIFDCKDDVRLMVGGTLRAAWLTHELAKVVVPADWQLYDAHVNGYGDPMRGYTFTAPVGSLHILVHTCPEDRSVQVFINSDLQNEVPQVRSIAEGLAKFFSGTLWHSWGMPTGIKNPVVQKKK